MRYPRPSVLPGAVCCPGRDRLPCPHDCPGSSWAQAAPASRGPTDASRHLALWYPTGREPAPTVVVACVLRLLSSSLRITRSCSLLLARLRSVSPQLLGSSQGAGGGAGSSLPLRLAIPGRTCSTRPWGQMRVGPEVRARDNITTPLMAAMSGASAANPRFRPLACLLSSAHRPARVGRRDNVSAHAAVLSW